MTICVYVSVSVAEEVSRCSDRWCENVQCKVAWGMCCEIMGGDVGKWCEVV